MGNHVSIKAESLQDKEDILVLQGLPLACPAAAAAQIHPAVHRCHRPMTKDRFQGRPLPHTSVAAYERLKRGFVR